MNTDKIQRILKKKANMKLIYKPLYPEFTFILTSVIFYSSLTLSQHSFKQLTTLNNNGHTTNKN